VAVTDVGYEPAKDLSKARCLNGIDDDHDGFIDGQDQGCLVGGDDTERGGTGATGASKAITFVSPRIYDVQKPVKGRNGDKSPLWRSRVSIRRGWLLVTRIPTGGLYVTDFEDSSIRWDGSKWTVDPLALQFDSIYAFNFSTPVNLQAGDCLVSLDGAVDEFYGYTEMSKPTWKKGDFAYCAAKARAAGLTDCPTDDALAGSPAGKLCWRRIETLATTPLDITKLMIKDPSTGASRSVFSDALLTEAFEAAFVKISNVKMFTSARNCDLDSDGVIATSEEKSCRDACGLSLTCTERSSYQQFGQWSFNFTDGGGATRELLAVTAAAIPKFNPMKKCKPSAADPRKCVRPETTLTSVAGILRDFQFGKPRWTLEARTSADCLDCKD